MVAANMITAYFWHVILNDIAEKSKSYILNEDNNNNILINIALRLWAGCMDATKSIAFETMDGANTPLMRERSFFQIDLFFQI